MTKPKTSNNFENPIFVFKLSTLGFCALLNLMWIKEAQWGIELILFLLLNRMLWLIEHFMHVLWTYFFLWDFACVWSLLNNSLKPWDPEFKEKAFLLLFPAFFVLINYHRHPVKFSHTCWGHCHLLSSTERRYFFWWSLEKYNTAA